MVESIQNRPTRRGTHLVRLHLLPNTFEHHALAVDGVLPLKRFRHHLDAARRKRNTKVSVAGGVKESFSKLPDVSGIARHVHDVHKVSPTLESLVYLRAATSKTSIVRGAVAAKNKRKKTKFTLCRIVFANL